MRKRTVPADDSARNELFGLSRSQSSFFLSEEEETSTSLGGNLHDLNDRQINKLIHIKFNDNPIELIRQLSQDLTSKEQELILLRKEQFIREQELLRLLNEYGNLSSLEIDTKLNNLKIDKKVDKVLGDLIGNAINEDLPRPPETAPKKLHSVRSSSLSLPQMSDESRGGNRQTWLSNWFHHDHSYGPMSSSTSSLPETVFPKFLPGFKRASESKQGVATSRVVELDSFARNEEKNSMVKTKGQSDVDTDKYGFYHDVNNLVKHHEDHEIMKKPLAESKSEETNGFEVAGTIDSPVMSQHQSYDKLKELGELHDAKNLHIEKQWDQFLQQINKGWHGKSGELANGEVFGLKGLNLISDSDKNETGDESNYGQLRHMINLYGIPPKYRSSLWMELSGASNLKVPGEYNQLVQISMEKNPDDARIENNLNQVKLDLHRTLPSNMYFNDVINSKPGPIYYKLQRILYAFIVCKPNIGYCQGMNKIIGNLLLGVNEEETVFWIFVALTEEILPHYSTANGKMLNFFDSEAIEMIRVDQQIMIDHFFPRVMPGLYGHLKRLQVQIEFITLNWWISVFTENFLNLDIWLKIFDNLLIGGDSTVQMMSLTLATFKIYEQLLVGIETSDEVYLIMKNLNRNDATKRNLKFSELIKNMRAIGRKIHAGDIAALRQKYAK